MNHDEINNGFYENIVYPIYQCKYGIKFGYKIIKILRQLANSQWLYRDEIQTYQLERLRKLIHHAYHNVPYYREVMTKMKITSQDINSVEDIKYFPILTKEIIRKNYDKLIAQDISKRSIIKASTGGSTGEPLKYIRDESTLIWTEAASLRGMSWAQYKIGDAVVDFMSVGWPSTIGKVRGKMINTYYFSSFAKQKEIIKYFYNIKKIQPFVLKGLASNLYRIATILYNYKIDDINIPVIFSTGEMLYDFQKDFLEKQFKSNVFDYYGCNEVGAIAFECEHHNKHISDERILMEITNSDGAKLDNALGEITITDLDNYAMPFIRYKNGDAGIISNNVCSCGRRLTMIESVEGRTQDFLKTYDGNYVSAIFFPSRFRFLKGINQYQIIQEDIHNITLKIVKNQFFSVKELEEILRVIKDKIGSHVIINVEEHPSIPLTEAGKSRLVISHLPVNLFSVE